MLYALSFTFCASLYSITLLTILLAKKVLNRTRNRIYISLVIGSLLICIADFLYYILALFQTSPIVYNLAYSVYWSMMLFWTALYCYYVFAIINKKKLTTNTIKEVIENNTFNKILLISCALLTIAICLIRKGEIPSGDILFYRSNILIIDVISIIIMLVYVICAIIGISKRRQLSLVEFKVLIYAPIIFIICFVLQRVYPTIDFLAFSYVFIILMQFFVLENPDVEVLNEIGDANVDIDNSSKTKNDFLSNMTYEITTPIGMINSLIRELSSMEKYDVNILQEDAKQIIDSGNNILSTINNILDISKLETGKKEVFEREYDVNDEIITNLINVLKKGIGEKNIKLIVNIDSNISTKLYGDSSRLYQSLVNIVENSIKYTEVGKIKLSIASEKQNGFEVLKFKISDTGIGIKDKDKSKVFSKSERDNDYTKKTGYGLVIAKEYIELIGGKIWFESQYQAGTTFYIQVIQRIVDSTPLSISIKEKTKIADDNLQNHNEYKVLIVDDNNLNIKVAKRMLEIYKLQIESVNSGNECVRKVKEGIEYDMILMDHMMPEMDGIETLHVLKKLTGYKLPPIVALTANAVAGMREMYLKEGFDDYLAKPINKTELDRVINRFLTKK